jgi:hypothetical protein
MGDNLYDRLRDAEESLAAWCEQLNAKWKEAEELLRSFQVSQPVWVCFKTETFAPDDPKYPDDGLLERCFEYHVGFVKHDKIWVICLSIMESGDPDSATVKPVTECSLQDRVAAMKALPQLLEAMVKHAEESAATIEEAIGAASEALAPFKRPKRGP